LLWMNPPFSKILDVVNKFKKRKATMFVAGPRMRNCTMVGAIDRNGRKGPILPPLQSSF